ncbi:glucose-6-phosphate dehydrogenase, partial [Maribellus luteus]
DMVQNHLLQLLCIVAMEPPSSLSQDAIRDEKLKILKALKPIPLQEVPEKTVRGQYQEGAIAGQPVQGYLHEQGLPPDSRTETFVAIKAEIANWRWAGVPFYLRTGKRMPERSSEIMIQFRAVPHSIFSGQDLRANRLTIRLQPEEEISLSLMNKTPSIEGVELKPVSLNLSLDDAFKQG